MTPPSEHPRRPVPPGRAGPPLQSRARRLLSGLSALAIIVGTPALGAIAGPVVADAAASSAGVSHGNPLVAVAARPKVPAGAKVIGATAKSRVLTGVVALKPRDPAGLTAFATAVSSPSASLYHHYLAPGVFKARFGPTAASIAAVKSELGSAGLSVTSVSSNGLLVGWKGTVAHAGAAFDTSFKTYRLKSGRAAYTQTTAVQLPRSIAGSVQSVLGLNNLAVAQPASAPSIERGDSTTHPKAAAPASSAKTTAGGPAACTGATGAATKYGGLTDTQIANAYGVNGLYSAGDTGAGQTVAIYELEPYSSADIKTFDTCYFGASKAASMLENITDIAVDGGQQLGTGSGESELDIEDVSAIAPGAKIDVYEAPNSTPGALDEYNAIVTDDAAKAITTSWGLCEAVSQAYEPGGQAIENTIFEQAAAQGQSVFAAAGDDGADTCAGHAATPVAPIFSLNDPASQPFVTSVGGTTITDATNPPKEHVWNDGNAWGAGGGGISSTWAAPAWQTASKVPGLFNPSVVSAAQDLAADYGEGFCAKDASTCRETPDVSAQADEFTGAITVYYEGEWDTFGGTSSATPLWAAMLTDINASKACTLSGQVGFANPALYAVASVPSEYAASFNDVTVGNIDNFGATEGLFPATRGYDMATGLGTPRITGAGGAKGLAYYLCDNAPAGGKATVTAVDPPAVSATTATPVTITGNGFETGSTPDVAGVQVGAVSLPAADIEVTSPTSITITSPLGTAEAATGAGTDGSGTFDVTVTLTNGVTSNVSGLSRLALFAPSLSKTALPVIDAVGPYAGNESRTTPVVIYGSGFSGATGVTFGGVVGTVTKVVDDDQIDAVAPAFSVNTTTCLAGNSPTTDICQSQVQVTTPNGSSAEDTILPEVSGSLLAPDPGTESVPAATEFDYLPTPTLTSITFRNASLDGYAKETGGTVVTLHGVGLGYLGLMWLNVGPASQASSFSLPFTSASGTADTVVLPAIAPTTGLTYKRVSIQTFGSLNNYTGIAATPPSNQLKINYAPSGLPKPPPPPIVKTVKTANGRSDGPDTGGTVVAIKGSGFDQAEVVVFTDTISPQDFSSATYYDFDVVSNTEILLETTGANAGIDQVQVCSATSCSTGQSTFTYYPAGNPVVAAVTPKSGSAGTKVKITGRNLGFITAVYFGSVKAKVFANGPALLDSGDPTLVTAVAPAGEAGAKVNIRVVTLESLSVKKYPKSPVNKAVTFTYRK
jgi:hypothetical protein